MDIDDFEFRSPADLIQEVAVRVPLTDGTAYAVLVADPSRKQQIRAIEELPCGAEIDDYDEARPLLEELCRRWDDGGDTRPHRIKVVTVIVRRGLCVWTPVEWAWSNAWRYSWTPISGGDLIVVTEHGWYDIMTRHADHQPALT